MQQDNKHIDKKLQELENQSLPDLSKMDNHWQQMATLLQPGVVPAKPKKDFPKKYFRWMIAAALIGGGFFIAYTLVNKSVRNKRAEGMHVQQTKTKTDTLPAIMIIPQKDIIRNTNTIISGENITISISPKPKKPAPVLIINPTPAKTKPDTIHFKLPPEESKPVQFIINEKATLNNFFKQLEKQPQKFVINNKKDTLITGEDGTTLLIPAFTFGDNDEVVITMKEFYSYEDIITNKLTTTSNEQQLITGGMIHIIATINGKETDIEPGKSIRWFVPDTTKEISRMQLFTGSTNQRGVLADGEDKELPVFFNAGDTTKEVAENINWIPQAQYFTTGFLETKYKVLDLSNEPYKTRETKKGLVGKFLISSNPEISNDELKTQLKEKYGYYKVKIKGYVTSYPRIKKIATRQGRLSINLNNNIGDSAWVTDKIAKIYNLKVTDTVTYTVKGIGYSYNSSVNRFTNIKWNALASRFSVNIRQLGWINCDRFYNEGSPKIDYYVDLKDTASDYYTLLVFDKIKSMMTGYTNGNKVVFSGVPAGETAKVISIGVQNGKTVAAMKNVQLSKKPLADLKFEETSPEAFKEEVKGLDK